MSKIKCPYCEGHAVLDDTVKIYKVRSYGLAFICENYPICDTYVGVHKGNFKALGTLANGRLRKARIKCHKAFDIIWKSGKLKRKEAYHKLRLKLGLTKEECHFGMFNILQCEVALPAIEEIKNELLDSTFEKEKTH